MNAAALTGRESDKECSGCWETSYESWTALLQAMSPQGRFERSWMSLEDISLSWHGERRDGGDVGMAHFTVLLDQP